MFACIYFEEDATLSVVGKNERNLKLLANFSSGSNVEMGWRTGKNLEIFHGTIVKIGDNEETLTTFANQANKQVLKGKCKPGSKVPEELFSFCPGQCKVAGKRERKKTSLIVESEQQEEQLSPKKKKKASHNEKPCDVQRENPKTPNKGVQSKGQVAGSSAVIENGKQMMALLHQFVEPMKEHCVPENEATEKEATKTVDEATKAVEKEASVQLLQQLPSTSAASSLQESSLSTTWKQCQDAMDIVHGGPGSDIHGPKLPVPTQEVLQTLKAVMQPDFQAFIGSLLVFYQEQHPWMSQSVLQNNTSNYWAGYDQSHEEQSQMESFSNVPLQTSTPVKHGYSITPMETPLRRSPRKNKQMSGNDEQLNNQVQAVPAASTSRSHVVDTSISTPSKQSDMVKLLESSNTVVDRVAKRKAISAAKKKLGREGYILMYRLTGEVFTEEEMASSKGLGIARTTQNDLRPSLDTDKVKDIKDFVVAWCKASKVQLPTESNLNQAVTERIGYARKKANISKSKQQSQ